MKTWIIAICLNICAFLAYGQTPEELGALAYKYQRDGFEEEAIRYGQDALSQTKNVYGEKDIRYAAALINLANLYRDAKKTKESSKQAENWYQKAFQYFRQHPHHQNSTFEGTLFFNYAMFLEKEKGLSKAKMYYQKAHAIYKKLLGEQHPLTAKIYEKIK